MIKIALMECDTAPTYVFSPTSRFKTVCDRIRPSHNITFRKATYEECLADGKNKYLLPDKRTFKKRVGALVSVGGAMESDYLSFQRCMSLLCQWELTL